jgi:hypothetical protein
MHAAGHTMALVYYTTMVSRHTRSSNTTAVHIPHVAVLAQLCLDVQAAATAAMCWMCYMLGPTTGGAPHKM